MTIAELLQEQTELQVGTERANTLNDYSDHLMLRDISRAYNRKGLRKVIEDFVAEKGQCVWADLGCGRRHHAEFTV